MNIAKHTNFKEVCRYIKNTRPQAETIDGYKKYYKIPIKRYKRKPVLVFSSDLIKYLVQVRSFLSNSIGYDKYEGGVDQAHPIIFALGQKDNKICGSELVYANGGCGIMTQIYSEILNEANYELIKRGYYPAGIARVGFFTKSFSCFGSGLSQIEEFLQTQGICFVSIGRTGLTVEFPNEKGVLKSLTNFAIK